MPLFELDRGQWMARLDENGSWRDCVFLSPDYIYCWAEHEGATPVCLFFEGTGTRYLYPFLLKQIPAAESRYAIHSVYGYGGLVRAPRNTAHGARQKACPEELREVNLAIDAWCAQHGVVSEFLRQQHLLEDDARLREALFSVARYDLFTELGDATWQSRLPAHAWRPIRKAREQALLSDVVPLADDLAAFHALYLETMARIGADIFYSLPRAYFTSLARSLGERASLIRLRTDDGVLVGAGLALASGRTAVFHLAASSSVQSRHGVNDLLYFDALSWAERRGFERVLLGGGRSTRPEDSLHRFKSKYATLARPFHIGRRIHDPAVHALLRENWLSANRERADDMKHVFQCYLF